MASGPCRCAVKLELANDLMIVVAMNVTKGGVSAGTRDHDHMIMRIVAEFIGSGFPADADRVRRRPEIFLRSILVKHPDLPRARTRATVR